MWDLDPQQVYQRSIYVYPNVPSFHGQEAMLTVLRRRARNVDLFDDLQEILLFPCLLLTNVHMIMLTVVAQLVTFTVPFVVNVVPTYQILVNPSTDLVEKRNCDPYRVDICLFELFTHVQT